MLCSHQRKQGDMGRELQKLRNSGQHNELDGRRGKWDSEDILKDLKNKCIQLHELDTHNTENRSTCCCRV